MKPCSYCGTENAPDAPACKSCGTSLLAAPPELPAPGTEPDARTVVLRTFSSQMNAEVVAQQLEQAGIRAMLTADDVGGVVPTLHVFQGIRLLIKASDRARAEQVLREIEEDFGVKAEGSGGDTGATPDMIVQLPKPAPHSAKLWFLVLGAVLGWLVHYAATLQPSTYTGTEDRDLNRDGRADAWWTFRRGEQVSSSLDRNFDGKPDVTTFYVGGWAATIEADENFDGKSDSWWAITNDVNALSRYDADFDGKLDVETRWEFGRLVESSFHASNHLGYWRRDFWTNSMLRETLLDRDRDGTLDERHVFDAFGTFLRVEPMK